MLRKERVGVEAVVHAAVETSRPLIDACAHGLTVSLPQEPLWLDADPTRMAQIVENLLNNAAKYTPPGGQIDLFARKTGAEVEISVSDTGVGIEAAMQPQIFQLFAQVDDHLSRAQGGLGIGLALVKQLATLHGGTIAVASPGHAQGSTFTLRLPLSPALPDAGGITGRPDAAPVPPGPVATQAEGRPLRILIVDNNILVADALSWMLEDLGHQCEVVHDGRKALDAARHFHPQAVLLDIGLPGMDGYQVCRAFREDETLRHVTVIAQTGWEQEKDKRLAEQAGFDHHMTKPVSMDDLERLLSRVP